MLLSFSSTTFLIVFLFQLLRSQSKTIQNTLSLVVALNMYNIFGFNQFDVLKTVVLNYLLFRYKNFCQNILRCKQSSVSCLSFDKLRMTLKLLLLSHRSTTYLFYSILCHPEPVEGSSDNLDEGYPFHRSPKLLI